MNQSCELTPLQRAIERAIERAKTNSDEAESFVAPDVQTTIVARCVQTLFPARTPVAARSSTEDSVFESPPHLLPPLF